ncbi:hypothetical protein SAY86_014838 [Trapa natans]|uniref:Sn1-specific diacylglycerol lipase alpha n=1 Tax=Trapa natans TaxID=22666 RepID=A0AAN7QH27_TRANT|nr:hypothetical protein SAY86_014838 [Trapa natans]
MAAGAVATAAGVAVLLYYVVRRTLASPEDETGDRSGDPSRSGRSVKRRLSRRPAQPPATLYETIATLSETLRFTYSETLGKWPIGDLAFGINYLMRRQGNIQVASIYAGSDCVQLKGPEILAEVNSLLSLLTLCMLFSKKPFPVFLESSGYSEEDVLLQKPKAGLLKPAFTIICDKNSKCFLLLIRGTHSIKDTLTAATGAVVPFHHSVLHGGGVSNLVLGYAHCGMVAAARWIAKMSTPFLIKALAESPDYKVKVVGHSLGGGTAALLTYILREQKEFSSSTCVTFAPAACMTWDLAESGKHFITTIINGSDLVPTFSTASVDDLRLEVTASSWLNDLRNQMERTRVLNVVYRSATALGSHLPSIASARARVASAGAFLRPVSTRTQGMMKRAQNVAQAVRTRSYLSAWSSCTVHPLSSSKVEEISETSLLIETSSVSLTAEVVAPESAHNKIDYNSNGGSENDNTDEDEDDYDELTQVDRVSRAAAAGVAEGQLWHELEKELHSQETKPDIQAKEEVVAVKEITEGENAVGNQEPASPSEELESHRFYPPGRIMHMVSQSTSCPSDGEVDPDVPTGERVGIYQTPRELYSKIRLSKTMIYDHYMPMYKKMMEILIRDLESEFGRECDV